VTKRQAQHLTPLRADLQKILSADLREITAQSDRIGRYFARLHHVSNSDFDALLHIMVAETTGKPLTLAQLRQRVDMSAAAVTYLVDRMIDAGHIRREADPDDRRKWLLRYEDHGMTLAFAFFTPLGAHIRSALADLDEQDLVGAHRVFKAMIAGMAVFEDELRADCLEASTARNTSVDPAERPAAGAAR
jgi:DNA-binding MarR family transcriptional regulator